jgi:hypothetical protein
MSWSQIALRRELARLRLLARIRASRRNLSRHDRRRRRLCKNKGSVLNHAWHAGIALGLWPDRDLAPQELEWLREETAALDPQRTAPPNNGKIQCLGKHGVSRTIKKLDIELPPMPLRDVRESVYGDRSAVTIGAVAPEALCILTKDQCRNAASIGWIAKLLKIDLEPTGPDMDLNPSAIRRAFRRAGIQFSQRPDGSFAGYTLTGETVLRTEKEWIITDVEMAEQMFREWKEGVNGVEERLDHLSDDPTDPRECASHISGSDQSGGQSPP